MLLRTPLVISLASCAASTTVQPAVAPPQGVAPAGMPVPLPAEFVAGRIFVHAVMSDGRELRLYTDSGGGWSTIFDATVKRLGLVTTPAQVGNDAVVVTPIPTWAHPSSLPAPVPVHGPQELEGRFVVMPSFTPDADGTLGESLFAGRVWTFDYPGKRLILRSAADVPVHTSGEEIPFHLRHGPRAQSYGRITVKVDGAPIDLLLDTGATLRLSPEGMAALHDGAPATRATSFIVRSIFDAWHAKHPAWRVIEHAEASTGYRPRHLRSSSRRTTSADPFRRARSSSRRARRSTTRSAIVASSAAASATVRR